MIVISTINFDESAADVMDWLGDEHVVRVNNDSVRGDFAEFACNVSPQSVRDPKGIWFRKGNRTSITDPSIPVAFRAHMSAEMYALSGLHYIRGRNTRVLGSADYVFTNKLAVLQKFESHGLATPPTLVTTKKESLTEFYQQHREVIVKPLSDGTRFSLPSGEFKIYVEKIDDAFISTLPETFFPALFQKHIPKEYEIRVFFLAGKCYCSAIFPQGAQNNTDYRKSLQAGRVRSVPYRLPAHTEPKLAAVMEDLRLNTGSIDIIRTPDGEYVFLEINPSGQFGSQSSICNYYIERDIAQFLSK
ncbi:MAG TPA: hypothetical protein VEB86_00910 [Chryseosolibacter sp.]|nr:hypothetical protein [Chryseosolibacter sp.]